jgi:type VI secretion system secreted protein Hcp
MRDRHLDDEVAQQISEMQDEDWSEMEATLRDKDNPAPIDGFVKMDGVDGESQDSKHKNEIEILGWKHSILQKGTFGTGSGGGAGVSFHLPFTIVKLVDKASPKLFVKCCTGEHFKTVTLTLRKAGKEQQDYRKITLTNAFITGYRFFEQADPVSGIPREGFSLDYVKIEDEAKAQDSATGSSQGSVKYSWDKEQRKKG